MRRTPRRGKGVISQKRLAEARQKLTTKAIEQLEEKRKEKGLYQREVARKIGVTEGMVSRFLTPPRNLMLSTLADLAAAMDCEVELRLKPIDHRLAA